MLLCYILDVYIYIYIFNKRMNGPYEKDALARESTLCVTGALIG
jgi:hypothetical protein